MWYIFNTNNKKCKFIKKKGIKTRSDLNIGGNDLDLNSIDKNLMDNLTHRSSMRINLNSNSNNDPNF